MSRSIQLTLLALFLACGPTGGDGGTGGGSGATGGGSGGGSSSSSSSFCCSINSDSYDCPNQAALDRCGDFNDPDPSQCTRRSSSCGGTGGGSGSTGGGGGSSSSKKDVGGTCQDGSVCQTDLCIFRSGAQFGYCTKECQSFADCPSFWDCEQASNGSAYYCVQR